MELDYFVRLEFGEEGWRVRVVALAADEVKREVCYSGTELERVIFLSSSAAQIFFAVRYPQRFFEFDGKLTADEMKLITKLMAAEQAAIQR